MKRELIKNLSDAKAGSGHKRNKSDSNLKKHFKQFSMYDEKSDIDMSKIPTQSHAKKASIIKREGDSFFELKES